MTKRKTLSERLVLILAVIMTVGILITGGCMGSTSESKRKKAVEMLAEKYGDDTIAYSAPYGGGVSGSSTKQILCTSEKFPDAVIWASYDKETGELIGDNYLDVKYQDSVNELIGEILADAFPDAVCYYSEDNNVREGLGNTLPADTTFEEYIAELSSGLCILAWVEADHEWDEEEVTEALEHSITERSACFYRTWVCFFDSMEYDEQLAASTTERHNLSSQKKYSNILTAWMEDTTSFAKTEWE